VRILFLTDTAEDLLPPEEPGGWFFRANARHDTAVLRAGIDPDRIQISTSVVPPFRDLLRLLNTDSIEAIHSFGTTSWRVGALAGRVASIPVIASLYETPARHSIDTLGDWVAHLPESVQRQGERWLSELTVHRIVVSDDLARRNMLRAGYPAECLEVVYPGVDIEAPITPIDRVELGLRPDDPLAVLVSDGDPGAEALLKMLPGLKARVPNAQVLFVGKHLGDLLLKVNPPLLIRWLPTFDNMRGVLAAGDAILHHPLHEEVPRAVIEAAAQGKAIVAARYPGITDLIQEGLTGLLVTPNDIKDYAIQSSRVLLQPTLARSLGQAAQQQAHVRFSLRSQIEAMTVLYEAAVYSGR
jgi:glycosyltransferase involved in cell wall biosynthesis